MMLDSEMMLKAMRDGAASSAIEGIFQALETLSRPQLPEDEEFIYHDWVLVRHQGVELGFADSEYQAAAPRFRWGHGQLLLTQIYFYAAFNDVAAYAGELPFELNWSDDRDRVRLKLGAFEATRHSFRTDTWDVGGYRLTVTYADGFKSIDRMVCRVLAQPIPAKSVFTLPALKAITSVFGSSVQSNEFTQLWGSALDPGAIDQAKDGGEVNWTSTIGATLAFAYSGGGTLFRAITLHRNRDLESAGWTGPLPAGLNFDDSPEQLFSKIRLKPVQQADLTHTGHAVWHFDDCTMHVLYSNLDNRLLRVKLMAPGTWRCMEDS
jgi:hypothetical protein